MGACHSRLAETRRSSRVLPQVQAWSETAARPPTATLTPAIQGRVDTVFRTPPFSRPLLPAAGFRALPAPPPSRPPIPRAPPVSAHPSTVTAAPRAPSVASTLVPSIVSGGASFDPGTVAAHVPLLPLAPEPLSPARSTATIAASVLSSTIIHQPIFPESPHGLSSSHGAFPSITTRSPSDPGVFRVEMSDHPVSEDSSLGSYAYTTSSTHRSESPTHVSDSPSARSSRS